MIGKKVLNHVYWHFSLTGEQSLEVQQRISEAERLTGCRAERDYNIVKYEINGAALSLLHYPDFFDAPFPVLATSYRIDLNSKRVEKRSYQHSYNPPVLHRKELLFGQQHPRSPEYRELTATAEQLGLIDGQFVPIGNLEIDAPSDD